MAFEPDTAPGLTIPAQRTGPGRAKGAWRLVSSLAGYVIAVALTFLGLLAITFFIGRVIPIDPVLAAVGDRAPKAVYEAARVQLGLDQPLMVQFVRYIGAVLSRRSRHVGLDRQGGRRRSQACLSGDAGNGDARHHHRRAAGRADGRLCGEPSRQAQRPDHPRGRPARLFRAGLLAGAGRARRLLRPAELGQAAPGRIDIFYDGHRAAGDRPAADRQPARRRDRHLLERRLASGAAGLGARLLQPRLYRAHDALLHARPAHPGICHDGAGQGRARAAGDLAPRLPADPRAADHRARRSPMPACSKAR